MRILWITNTRFPATCHKFGLPSPNTGGWIFSLAQELIKKDWITLEVATVYDGRDYQSFKEDKILYHLLPKGKSITRYDTSLEVYWPQIIEKLHPNLIHIHGTE